MIANELINYAKDLRCEDDNLVELVSEPVNTEEVKNTLQRVRKMISKINRYVKAYEKEVARTTK
jgi:hypothetical protein